MSISIIIPTIGRKSLRRTIDSVLSQCKAEDQIIVIGDGPQPKAEKITSTYPRLVEYHEIPFRGCWGHPQRNYGMELATGTHLSFMDDDDYYTTNALRDIRTAIYMHPKSPFIFQMQYPNSFKLWQKPTLVSGNVGTPMIVVPNDRKKLGVWGKRREGDFDFLNTMGWEESEIWWYPIVIAQIGFNEGEERPQEV